MKSEEAAVECLGGAGDSLPSLASMLGVSALAFEIADAEQQRRLEHHG